MRLIRLPGVHRPISDAWILADAMRAELTEGRRRVLDLCTGTGVLAISAAQMGAEATAIDLSRRALACARVNSRLNGVRVEALRGDLFEPVRGRRFDVIVTNPPYVPGPSERLPERGLERAWYAGLDGRVLVDRICDAAADHLLPGGVVLMVHSSINDEQESVRRLAETGLEASVPVRERGPLGPLFGDQAEELERRGLLTAGQREEEVVVVRGERPPE
jgi:release factor glutamine methyltransferase